MKKKHLRLSCFLLAIFFMTALAGCAAAGESSSGSADKYITDVSQLKNGVIAVWSGSICEIETRKILPDATYDYYYGLADMATAVQQGKADTLSISAAYYASFREEMPDLKILGEPIATFSHRFIVRPDAKGDSILDDFNRFLAQAKQDGLIEELVDIWYGTDKSRQTIDRSGITGEKGTLRAITSGVSPVFTTIKNGEPSGFEVDLLAHFCAACGYDYEVEIADFSGITPAISSGKCDIGFNGLEYSEERAEEVRFTDEIQQEPLVLVVRGPVDGGSSSLWSRIAVSFEKTFLRENRWVLFLQGIMRTLLITVLSILLGTLLGFLVYLFCRKGGRIANAITNGAKWLVDGMPIVVLLMVFYYILFAKASINGIWVSVLCFTLSFASDMLGMLRSGVDAVEAGQLEGARALGYTDRQAFFKVILPQATVFFLPSYKGSVVSLIKATAIVGYIAVQDLTKVSDIVRSSTYSPFFPLIATSVIYFLLAGLLVRLIRKIQWNLDFRNRPKEKILSGLKGGEAL